jgi:hypothetical protein
MERGKTTIAIVEGPYKLGLGVELLGPRLGRAMYDIQFVHSIPRPISHAIVAGDVVRLSHDPGEAEGSPKVTEVVVKAGPRFHSEIECHTDEQMYRLTALAAVLGGVVVHARLETNPYTWQVEVQHWEWFDMHVIAKAAGVTAFPADLKSPPIHLCKIPFFDDEQAHRMVALAVVVDAEVMYIRHDPNEIVLFHAESIDLRALADAAHIATDPRDLLEIDVSRASPPPGALAGPEWGEGQWGSFDAGKGPERGDDAGIPQG